MIRSPDLTQHRNYFMRTVHSSEHCSRNLTMRIRSARVCVLVVTMRLVISVGRAGSAENLNTITADATSTPISDCTPATQIDQKLENSPSPNHSVHRGDWTEDAPGVRHRIAVTELSPTPETSPTMNRPHIVARPPGAQLHVPRNFKIEEFAVGLSYPRFLLPAPNGDIFVTESDINTVKVLRDTDGDGKCDMTEIFADTGMKDPFGIAFYPPGPEPQFLYVANTNGIVRFPYRVGDTKARGPIEKLGAELSGGGLLPGGGHWTRCIVFSSDGKKMYVGVGSFSDISDNAKEADRARIFEFNPDGTDRKVFAWGLRDPVGIAFRPDTNELWMSANERDDLGDDLVPDFISRVQRDGFYGWPWYYIGNHEDPRHKGKHPELASKVLVPDVLVQSHSATLNLCFYDGAQFPSEYKGDIFAAFHGSYNRTRRTGYKIVRVPFDKATGKARGDYEDFVTGFVTPDGDVWGRPVGITIAKDGSLLFSEDGNKTIWRVSYPRK
ncbi:MAG TPA: PQQ-dependent sugar dehydrogenase [Chthoniobacterales bacterium]|nr:PQQ-dependent sugar dehydrogenase [Chthoniobacterales bacterium]